MADCSIITRWYSREIRSEFVLITVIVNVVAESDVIRGIAFRVQSIGCTLFMKGREWTNLTDIVETQRVHQTPIANENGDSPAQFQNLPIGKILM